MLWSLRKKLNGYKLWSKFDKTESLINQANARAVAILTFGPSIEVEPHPENIKKKYLLL